MLHINKMAFGTPGSDGSIVAGLPLPSALARPPLSCKATLALAAIPLLVIGVHVPAPLQNLLMAAARAMGG